MYRINHPNIIKLYGHFEDNTYCYFIIEYMPGGNIYSLVPKYGHKKISTQTVASILKDIISATYYLHHMTPPIIHRDIKPENILINSQMQAKLIDFGWSNYLNRMNMKRTTMCGTPVYLAPELVNNIGHDHRVDIWCIGVFLFFFIFNFFSIYNFFFIFIFFFILNFFFIIIFFIFNIFIFFFFYFFFFIIFLYFFFFGSFFLDSSLFK